MKRCLVLVTAVLIAAVFLAAGCGGSSEESANSSEESAKISGKYEYKDNSTGQIVILNYKSDGTATITVPAFTDLLTNEQVKRTQNTYYYEATSKSVGLWKAKKKMASEDPYYYFTISKDTLTDPDGWVFVKEGTASEKEPSSSAPSSTP